MSALLPEFALIERLRARTSARADIVLGIGDDAAIVQPAPGAQLLVTADTLNAGVHFPSETAPADIGWKALAVNLSDLAAMGAVPAWCTLSLSLPAVDDGWLAGFADGFFALADAHGIALIGGDTTRGPLSISVTAMGCVPAGTALRRDGARAGDDVWVSGTPGDAGGALQAWKDGALAVLGVSADAHHEALRQRLVRPTPRVLLGQQLRALAHSGVDISDGLIADLGHICTRSGVGAQLQATALPLSGALQARFALPRARAFALSGGDDYELCFTAPPAHRDAIQALAGDAGCALTVVGRIVAGTGVSVTDGLAPAAAGYQHFG